MVHGFLLAVQDVMDAHRCGASRPAHRPERQAPRARGLGVRLRAPVLQLTQRVRREGVAAGKGPVGQHRERLVVAAVEVHARLLLKSPSTVPCGNYPGIGGDGSTRSSAARRLSGPKGTLTRQESSRAARATRWVRSEYE